MSTINPNRFQNIDCLRGIAALLVVWQHSSEAFVKHLDIAQHGTMLADLARDYDFGRIGIICFFLISGFVIPSSLKDKDSSGIKHFAIRRFFRLYPAYWVSILLAVILSTLYESTPDNLVIVANITMIQGLLQQPHLIGLFWTLQVELIFYVMCALLFYFKLLRNDKVIFALIVVFFGIFVLIQALPYITNTPINLHKETQLLPYILSIMFLGYFFRKLYDRKNAIEKLNTENKNLNTYSLIATIMCLGLPITLLIIYLLGYDFIPHAFRFGMGHTLGFILFFLGLFYFNKVPKNILWLGTISYSLYLIHPLVMRVFIQVSKTFNSLQGFHVSFYMIITAVLSIVVATVIYKLIEKPAIQYARKLTTRNN